MIEKTNSTAAGTPAFAKGQRVQTQGNTLFARLLSMLQTREGKTVAAMQHAPVQSSASVQKAEWPHRQQAAEGAVDQPATAPRHAAAQQDLRFAAVETPQATASLESQALPQPLATVVASTATQISLGTKNRKEHLPSNPAERGHASIGNNAIAPEKGEKPASESIAPDAAPAVAIASLPELVPLHQSLAAPNEPANERTADASTDTDTTAAELPIADAPVASAPVASAPVANAPVANAPVASAPVASAPIASAPIASAPVANAPIANAPVANAPVANAPVASAPVAGAPVAGAPVAGAPVASAPIAVAPVAAAPVARRNAPGNEEAISAQPQLFVPPHIDDEATLVATPSTPTAVTAVATDASPARPLAAAPSGEAVALPEATLSVRSESKPQTERRDVPQSGQVAPAPQAERSQPTPAPAQSAAASVSIQTELPLFAEAVQPQLLAALTGQRKAERSERGKGGAAAPTQPLELRSGDESELPTAMPKSLPISANDTLQPQLKMDANDPKSALTASEGRATLPTAAASDKGTALPAAAIAQPHASTMGSTSDLPRPPETARLWQPQEAMIEIARSARDGQFRLEMQLNPEHLGKIHVSLTADGNRQVQVHLVVDQSASRQLLEQNLPHLRQALAQQGLNLGDFSMQSGQGGGQGDGQRETPNRSPRSWNDLSASDRRPIPTAISTHPNGQRHGRLNILV